jgi:hypothetical protein
MSDMDDINEKMKEIEEIKKRIEQKLAAQAPQEPKVQKRIVPIRTKRIIQESLESEKEEEQIEEQEEEQEEESADPVSRYLGGGKKKIEQIRKEDKDFIHKRIAAQEVLRWVKKGTFLFTMNIIGFFVFYLMIVMGAGVMIDVIMVVMVIINAFFLVQMRKHQIYLTRRYNIQTQRGFLSGMGIPKIRRYNPRGPQFQQRPRDFQYDENDPQEYQDGGQQW